MADRQGDGIFPDGPDEGRIGPVEVHEVDGADGRQGVHGPPEIPLRGHGFGVFVRDLVTDIEAPR